MWDILKNPEDKKKKKKKKRIKIGGGRLLRNNKRKVPRIEKHFRLQEKKLNASRYFLKSTCHLTRN